MSFPWDPISFPRPVEYCIEEHGISFFIDLAFNIVHLLHFGLRVSEASTAPSLIVHLKNKATVYRAILFVGTLIIHQ